MGHEVDRRRASQYLSALELDAPAVEIRLRLAHVVPVEHPRLADLTHPERDVDNGMPVPAAGLEKQNAGVLIFAQPRSEHTAGGPATDDHIVELFSGHGPRQ